MDPRAQRFRWLVVVALYWALNLVYMVMPLDLIPDVVPIVGVTDDAAGVVSAVVLTVWTIATRRLFGGRRGAKALPGPK